MTVLFHDDFDSASAVNLEAHAPNVGTSYTKLTSGASATIAAGAGQAVFKDGARIAYTLNGVNTADVVFTSLLQWSGSGDVFGFWFRRSTDTGPGLVINIQEGSPAALYYYNGSTYTPLTNGSGGTGTLGNLPSDGRFGQVTLTVSLIGNRLVCQSGSTTFVDFTTTGQVTGAGKFQLEIMSGNNAILQWVDVTDNGGSGGGDVTAPTLTSPVGTATGAATATVGATTDEGNGTMYAIVTTSATPPSATQIQAGQTSAGAAATWSGNVAVSSTGAKTFSATGLAASTTYYAHIQHKDAAGNNSTVVTSASFTTSAGGDVTPPTLSAGTATQTGPTTATVGATTNEANGTMYAVLTTSATAPSAAQVIAGQNNSGAAAAWSGNQAIGSTGAKTFNATGLASSTTYYAYVVHRDAAGNSSSVLSAGSLTTASGGATVTSQPLSRNNGAAPGAITLTWVTVLNAGTGAFVATKSGVVANASSVFSVADANIVAGTTYTLVWLEAGGQRGTGTAVAA